MNITMTSRLCYHKKHIGNQTQKKKLSEVWVLKFTLTTIKAHLYLPASVLWNVGSWANITEYWKMIKFWRSISHLPLLHFIGGKTPWRTKTMPFGGEKEIDSERIKKTDRFLKYQHNHSGSGAFSRKGFVELENLP